METYVCDTHPLFWYLTSSSRLGRAAAAIFQRADRGEVRIVVPAIVWCELYYLNEKIGAPLDVVSELEEVSKRNGYACPPFDPGEISRFGTVAGIREMHDRMVASAAYHLGVPCITRDAEIVGSGLVTCVFK